MAIQDFTVNFVDRPRAQATFGRAYTLTCKVLSDGTQVVPTTATIDVKRPGGAPMTTAVAAASATVDGSGTITYAIVAGNTDLLGSNHIAVWYPVIGGVTYDFVQLFDVVRYPLRNNVQQADLVLHHPDLSNVLFTGEASFQVYTEQAFEDVYQWLDAKGKRPALVLSSEDLRRPIEHLALHKAFMARTNDPEDRWGMLAAFHLKEYDRWISSAALVYDTDQSGSADGTATDGNTGEEGGSLGFRFRI